VHFEYVLILIILFVITMLTSYCCSWWSRTWCKSYPRS